MLDFHLIAKTSPKALQENLVYWRSYRVTVLQDRLFRLERNAEKSFRDGATQIVWFRDCKKQPFTVEEGADELRIGTDKCTLILREKREDCRILLNTKELEISNEGNLLGTYRTLDRCDGSTEYPHPNAGDCPSIEISLETGVCSRTGVAVFDDAQSLTLQENGEVCSERGRGTDEYIFAYGKDYREAIKALYRITGTPPLIPRYAFGNWWSRYHDYTDREYLALLNNFKAHDIPLTVATIDMDWHYSKQMEEDLHITEKGRNTPFYGGNNGWTGYSWNPAYFPDYKKFLRQVAEKDLKITLNLHPAGGIRWWEDCYPEMAKAMGVDPESGEQIRFDIANPQFINSYFSVVLKPYEKDGVAFWWIDWQQGTKSGIEGLDPLWALNHYHTLDHAKNHEKPMILSRYSGIGSHRYPLGFSGDTFVSWKTLRYLPYFTSTASNVGFTWWSHDIGGHMLGTQDNELYVRHIQYGVFSPINRLHPSPTITKEPWVYGNGAGAIAEKFLRLRHQMIPFLYSCNYRTHQEGIALVEPLYYQWSTSKHAYEYPDEYLFGGQLLVAPVTDPIKADGFARVKMWIPEGKWTDIFTGDIYHSPKGGCVKTLLRQMDSIPVLAKAGALIPFSRDKGNSVKNPSVLHLDCYTGDGEFTLYEDGDEMGEKGEHFTFFQSERAEGKQTVTITSQGDRKVLPKSRKLLLNFPELTRGKAKLFVDDKEILLQAEYAYNLAYTIDFESGKEYKIQVEYTPFSQAEELLFRARRIIDGMEEKNTERARAYGFCRENESVEKFVAAVKDSHLRKVNKQRLLETL